MDPKHWLPDPHLFDPEIRELNLIMQIENLRNPMKIPTATHLGGGGGAPFMQGRAMRPDDCAVGINWPAGDRLP